ncbi:hypothetical protein Agub_g9021, partial [Astrephomene gubernaculifera]
NESFPAPLAPPPPPELCAQLGLQAGEAEYDAVVFLRDLVVLLQVAQHAGFTAEDLVTAVIRSTGYEAWMELELGARKDLAEEQGQLRELVWAAEQFGARWGAGEVGEVKAGEGVLQALAAYIGPLLDGAEGARKRSEADPSPSSSSASASASLPPDCVRLLTLHGAKGLEFPAVFVAGCEEGLLPYCGPAGGAAGGRGGGGGGGWGGSALQVEEERRLLFVGATRAMDQLYLTWAATRAANRQRHREQREQQRGRERGRAAARDPDGEAGAVAAAATAAPAERRGAARRQRHLSPFLLDLLQELQREGRVVEAAPDAAGCISGWQGQQQQGEGQGEGQGQHHTPPPPPLLLYHDTTGKHPLS